MVQVNIAMELGARIDISEIIELKIVLEKLPINTPQQVISARDVTHIDSASCQLLYAYSQYLLSKNSTLVINQPSKTFSENVKMLGFESHFNYL